MLEMSILFFKMRPFQIISLPIMVITKRNTYIPKSYAADSSCVAVRPRAAESCCCFGCHYSVVVVVVVVAAREAPPAAAAAVDSDPSPAASATSSRVHRLDHHCCFSLAAAAAAAWPPPEAAWLLAVVVQQSHCCCYSSMPKAATIDSGSLPAAAAAAEAWEEVALGEAFAAAGSKTCWPTPAREATTRPKWAAAAAAAVVRVGAVEAVERQAVPLPCSFLQSNNWKAKEGTDKKQGVSHQSKRLDYHERETRDNERTGMIRRRRLLWKGRHRGRPCLMFTTADHTGSNGSTAASTTATSSLSA